MKDIERAWNNDWTDLVPEKRGAKYPGFKDWQDFVMTPALLQKCIDSNVQAYGLLAAHHPGVDIDITSVALVKQIRELAWEILGKTPVRTGNFPKCLLPYNTLEPFTKRTLKIQREGMDKPWLIEILGDGQQYVLMGKHPDGGDYLWSNGGSPATTHIDKLPLIDADMADEFLRAVADKLNPEVWTVTFAGGNSRSEEAPSADVLAAPSIDDVRTLVEGTPNEDYFGWDEMMNMARAIKGATGGSADGLAIYEEWCDKWEGGDHSQVIRDKAWEGTPTVGWDWLMKLATDHGASTVEFDFDCPADQPVTSVVVDSLFKVSDVYTAGGVARWMVAHDIIGVRYDPLLATWHVFEDGRWKSPRGNNRGGALTYSVTNPVMERMYEWLREQPAPATKKDREARGKALARLQTVAFADVVRLEMARTLHWNFSVDEFNGAETNLLLNTPAGTYDLIEYKMRPHDPSDLITKQTLVSPKFDDSKLPNWLGMFDMATSSAEEIDYLQRYLGAAMGGTTANKMLLILIGASNSGKSTITDTIATNVLGVGVHEYAQVTGILDDLILRRPNAQAKHPTGLNKIRNARFGVSHEGGESMRWNEEVIKTLTGGDAIAARGLFEEGDTRRFFGRLIATSNKLPQTDFIDSGMRQRLRILRMKVIAGYDTNKREAIEAEAEYILGWLIEGHKKNVERPVHETEYTPESVLSETQEALEEGDPLRSFVDQMLTLAEVTDNWFVRTGELYEAFQEFCLDRDYNPGNIRNDRSMGRALKDMEELREYYKKMNTGSGYMVQINKKDLQAAKDRAAIQSLLD